ncbi:MAG: 16S rRNA (cytidine(1402)-2'-O)-methyltransferase [Dehalococcoidia bacterium]|nr:16S rRNA (cytidine(1402)-2'-O)-methyltransferase [Dehalococcoidia bacterium]
MPVLYIVPTPIGNLEDITLRALRVLAEADLIAAEDTRVTRKLLARYSVSTPTTSFHEHNKARKTPHLLDLLPEKDIALVSDAGTPTLNDPGQQLVAAAASAGFTITALPGASAITTAVAISGIPADGFVYLGYLPNRKAARTRFLDEIASEPKTLVAFETPHRLTAALADVLTALGDRRMAVCRELTKMHEEIFRGTVSEAIDHFTKPRGEFTLVIEGAGDSPTPAPKEDAREILAHLKGQGASARDAIATAMAATGLSRRELYSVWLTLP